MARHQIVAMSDDIDGGKAHESVAFGLNGVGYEIDLHSKKAAALRKSLAEFVAGARRVHKSPFGQPAAPRRPATTAKRSPEEPTPTQIREWRGRPA